MTLPAYDSTEGTTAYRCGRLVSLWVHRHGESWRDEELARRAVQAWHHEEGKRTMERATRKVA